MKLNIISILYQVFPDYSSCQTLCTTSTLTPSMVQSLQLYVVGWSHQRRRKRKCTKKPKIWILKV